MTTRFLLWPFLAAIGAGAAIPASGSSGATEPTAGAAATSAAARTARVTPASSPMTAPTAPSDELHRPLTAELELERITAGAGGEAPDLVVRLASRFGGPASATYVFEVRDDRGRLALPRARPAPFALQAGAEVEFALWGAPLADGMYRATVIAAARTADDHGVAMPELYFESRGGVLTPLDFAEFAERSSYNVGVSR